MKQAGVLTHLQYHFAFLPTRTIDQGWIWFANYQEVKRKWPSGEVTHYRIAHWHNYYIKSWTGPTACKGDGTAWIETDLRRSRNANGK